MVAQRSNVGAFNSWISTGSASHLLQNETEKTPPRDVFTVLVYPTIESVFLVVEDSDHEGRHMISPSPFPLRPRDYRHCLWSVLELILTTSGWRSTRGPFPTTSNFTSFGSHQRLLVNSTGTHVVLMPLAGNWGPFTEHSTSGRATSDKPAPTRFGRRYGYLLGVSVSYEQLKRNGCLL